MPKCMAQSAKTPNNPIVHLCLALPDWLQAPYLKSPSKSIWYQS